MFVSIVLQVTAIALPDWITVRVVTHAAVHPTRGESQVDVNGGLFTATSRDCCEGIWRHTANAAGVNYCPAAVDNCVSIRSDTADTLCPRAPSADSCNLHIAVRAVRGLAFIALIASIAFLVVLYFHLGAVAVGLAIFVTAVEASAALVWEVNVKDTLLGRFVAYYGPTSSADYTVQNEAGFFVFVVALMLAFVVLILSLAAMWVVRKERQAARRAAAVEAELGIVDSTVLPGFSQPGRALRGETGPEINPVTEYFPPVPKRR